MATTPNKRKSAKPQTGTTPTLSRKRMDPLFQMFEHFLLTRSYEDSAAFTKQLAEQYILYLDSTPAHVPFDRRTNVLEDLTQEAHEMLVKKMYGVVKPSDYENSGVVMRMVEDDLRPLEFNAAAQADQKPPEKPTSKG